MPRRRGLPQLSLRWKLPLVVGGVSLALAVAIYGAAYLGVRRDASRAAQERLAGVVDQIAALLARQGAAMAADLTQASSAREVHGYFVTPTATRAAPALSAIQKGRETDTSIVAIVLRGPDGGVLASVGSQALALAALLDQRELPTGPADTAVVGRFRALEHSVYFPVVALVTEGGLPKGYVTLWHRLNTAPNARGPVAQLIGSNALLLMGSPGGAWISEAGPVAPPMLEPEALSNGLYHYDRSGEPVLAAIAPARGTPWSVAVEFPASVVSAPARRFVAATAPVGFGILALALLLAWAMSQSLITPLHRLIRASESLGHGDLRARVGAPGNDEIGLLSASFDRMAERMEEEAAARAATEAQWRLIFDGSPHPMWVVDRTTGELLAVNPAALAAYGYSAAEFLDLSPELLELPPTGAPSSEPGLRRHRTKGGEVLDVEVTEQDLEFNGRAARFVLAQNVTSRTLLESRFRQAQKMQAIGRLAGGVAHDFNNFLTAISAYAELMREGFSAEEQHAKDLDEILRASAQATRLTRQLLAFSRQQVVQPTVLDVDSAVHAMSEMLRRLIREDIALVIRLESRHSRIKIDGGHLEQVLMNLVVNARDAMPKGGHLTLATSQVDVTEEDARLQGLTNAGRYVTITVTDDGSGMSAETKARLFEPFFTTKGVGHGTGLGLATAYGIVNQAGGVITVYSELGVGSTFRIYLPLVLEEASVEPTTKIYGKEFRGTETILLVEDEASVRSATQHALERQGYTVLSAADPEAAMALVEQHQGPLHLVVSDVVMPKTDGPTLIGMLRKRRPELKALLMSGYAGDALPRIDSNGHLVPFIEKPFTIVGLAKKIREVLGG